MEIIPQIVSANVMHKRLFPKVNSFHYKVYYLALPLKGMHAPSLLENLSVNRPAFISFYTSDHGARDGSDLEHWIYDIIKTYNMSDYISDIILVAMPRVLGYVFNPISVWFCLDSNKEIRAVLCEVSNTFGETHCYFCAHPDTSPIGMDDWLDAEKIFHVSPFLEREGSYKFRFLLKDNRVGIWIDFYNAQGKRQLMTSLTGTLQPLTKQSLRQVVCKHPLVTFKTIFLIHWQACKLVMKGIKYIAKPMQLKEKLSSSLNITKM